MSEINIICPHCNQTMTGEEGYRGMQINCPKCKQLFLVVEAQYAPAAKRKSKKARSPTPPLPNATAVKLYREAAEQGSPEAQFELAKRYETGIPHHHRPRSAQYIFPAVPDEHAWRRRRPTAGRF
jgi:phage FluMu protein Com